MVIAVSPNSFLEFSCKSVIWWNIACSTPVLPARAAACIGLSWETNRHTDIQTGINISKCILRPWRTFWNKSSAGLFILQIPRIVYKSYVLLCFALVRSIYPIVGLPKWQWTSLHHGNPLEQVIQLQYTLQHSHLTPPASTPNHRKKIKICEPIL